MDGHRQKVQLGIDRVASGECDLPGATKVAVLTNRAATTSTGQWTVDVIRERSCTVEFLLGPEHGLDAQAPAGASVAHSEVDGIPVLSLYGDDLDPVRSALQGIDTVLIDLQDFGTRYCTYPSTVRQILSLGAPIGIKFIILDRPNPLGGVSVQGSLPAEGYDSPVCAAYVPVRHGLTLGELALWQVYHGEIDVDLSVVQMHGWRRGMLWPGTGLDWTPPSPNLRTFEAAALYPGTCLFEGTNLSEGRGTDAPFQNIGAPFVDGARMLEAAQSSHFLEHHNMSATTFTPTTSKWRGEVCQGLHLRPPHRHAFRAVIAGLALVQAARQFPQFEFLPFFDTLAGTAAWREALESGVSLPDIRASWAEDEDWFRHEREQVLLYD